MKKMHEYLEHAAECREMARTASPAHRAQLEQMALTWEQLAASRKRHLEKNAANDEYNVANDEDNVPEATK